MNISNLFWRRRHKPIEVKGVKDIAKHSDFMLPKYAKDYATDELPTIQYKLWQWKDPRQAHLFYMKLAFVQRRKNYLVVDFTIVAKE